MGSSFEEILRTQGKLVYTNVGNSMMPLLRQRRDLLIIAPKPLRRLRVGEVPLFKRDNGKYILHRVLWRTSKGYVMLGDNQWHPEFGITDAHIVGLLEAVTRDGRKVALVPGTEHGKVPFWYRAYVWALLAFLPLRIPVFLVRDKWMALRRWLG